MPGISASRTTIPFGRKAMSWDSYWATLISATVETAAPTHVVLTFPAAQTSLTDTDFTIAGFTISSASWAGTVLTLIVSTAVVAEDTVVVTFVKSGGTAAVTNNVTTSRDDYIDHIANLFGANVIQHLPLYETSSYYADDVSPQTNDGIYHKATNTTGGILFGENGIGDGRTSVKLNGTNDLINLYSSAFASDFNGQEGTVIIWVKVANSGVWTDGVERYILRLGATSNLIEIKKRTVNNNLEFTYVAGGTQKQYRPTGQSSTGWLCLAFTWSLSNNRALVYINGSQVGSTLTGLGTWSYTLVNEICNIGAENFTSTKEWSGWVAHFILLNREASTAEIADAYTLPSTITSSVSPGSSRTVVTLADGGNINTALSSMRGGDTLSLATSGTYTFGAGVSGFSTISSGNQYGHTKILGNGATVSGGNYPMIFSAKNYIDVENINVGAGELYSLYVQNSSYHKYTDCDVYNPATGSSIDTARFDKNCHYFELTRCDFHSTTDVDATYAHDGCEIWGPCTHFVFTDCKAYDVKNGATDNEGHGFEIYGQDAGEICDDIKFTNCEAYNCQVGFSCEGGALSLEHTNIVCDGCSSHDNAFYGYQGIEGSTLFRQNVAGHDNTDNGVSETNGTVTDI